LQAVAQLGHRFAIAGFFPATHARQRTVEVVAARLGLLHTLAQRVLDIQAGGATEYHQVEQRVAAEAVGTVYRYARHFTHGEQAINDFRVAFMTAAQAQRLAVNVGRDTTHHVVTGRHYRNRLLDRVGMTEGLGQLTDTRQARVQYFFAQVVEFQVDVVTVRAATTAVEDFHHHGACDHVTTGKVLGVRCITLHEALAILVDQVATLTTAAFCYQDAGAGDAGRVELPHFNVLHRHASAQRHADTVAGVDQGVGGGRIDTAGTTGGKYRGFCLEKHHL